MKITERKLRSIIRSVILEDLEMRDRLKPRISPKLDKTDRAFARQPNDLEMSEVNAILRAPLGSHRDKLVGDFGVENFYQVCDYLGIDPDEVSDYDIGF